MSTSNSKHGSFLFENNENTYPKGRALMQMYRVVPQTKKRECKLRVLYAFLVGYNSQASLRPG